MRRKYESLDYELQAKYSYAVKLGYMTDGEDQREWKHTFVGAFIWKNPSRTKVIQTFEKILGHLPLWEDMTDVTLRDFVEELKSQGLALSSVRTMCAELKAVLNANFRQVPSDKYEFAQILSIKKTVSQAVYLTDDEMGRFIDYVPASDLEHYVHRNFIVGMLTGARLIDAERLTLNNCNQSTNTLSYVPKKTPGIVVTVPVDERRGLRKYLADTKAYYTCQDTFNETLRIICHKCGFISLHTITRAGKTVTDEKWKFISSHTARRTFATNLYLAGVTLEDIALMMGHGKNIETSKRYICEERKITPAVLAYFLPHRDVSDTPAYKSGYNDAIDCMTSILLDGGIISENDMMCHQMYSLKK